MMAEPTKGDAPVYSRVGKIGNPHSIRTVVVLTGYI